ncbi:hypothetical protein GCM10027447_27750 [Glycomyces halotolerans]
MAVVRQHGKARLRAEDWAAAALRAVESGGLEAVAVERLARELGATKGSFYWHFANRQALVEAAMGRWEQEQTDAVIDAMQRIESPAQRLNELLAAVLDHRVDPLEVALFAAVQDPVVGDTVARVTRRRIDYVASLYRATGMSEDTAYSSAVTAVAAYLGHMQLAHATPGALPTGDRWAAHRDRVREMLVDRPVADAT